jgi:hypothetical protein
MFKINIRSLFYRDLRGDRKSFPEANCQAHFAAIAALEKFCLILIPGACTIKLFCSPEKSLPVTNGLAYFATLSLLNKVCLILILVVCAMKLLKQPEKIGGDNRVSLFCCFIIVE